MKPEELPLRDLHLPATIDWWPLAYGWWILLGLLLLTLGYIGYQQWMRWREGAARRRALSELKRLQEQYAADGDAAAFVIAVSTLLRRGMLAYAPRAEVAGLSGDHWLAWLDRGLPEPYFSEGEGRCLHDLPYRPPGSVTTRDVAALAELVRRRLRTPVQGQL